MTKLSQAMREAPDNGWQLDNCVNLPPAYATQHRTWRPVRDGRPVYSDPGFALYTICGRPIRGVAGCKPGPKCGVCFRGTDAFASR